MLFVWANHKQVVVNVEVKPSRLFVCLLSLPRAALRLPPVTYIGKPMCIAFQASPRHYNIILCFQSFPMIFPLSLFHSLTLSLDKIGCAQE